MGAESLIRCHRISGLLEIERTWAQLHTPGILRKVGLLPLPQAIVQVKEAPADLGKYIMLHKEFFYLFLTDRFFLFCLQI